MRHSGSESHARQEECSTFSATLLPLPTAQQERYLYDYPLGLEEEIKIAFNSTLESVKLGAEEAELREQSELFADTMDVEERGDRGATSDDIPPL